jgi:hypothetical protein
MSLDWSVTGVADWENVTRIVAEADDPSRGITKGDKLLNPITHAIIFRCMAVGIGRITEQNFMDFYCRSRLLDDLGMPAARTFEGMHMSDLRNAGRKLLDKIGDDMAVSLGEELEALRSAVEAAPNGSIANPRTLTLAEIKAHIGLRTNVTTEPRAKWQKRIVDVQLRDYERNAKDD